MAHGKPYLFTDFAVTAGCRRPPALESLQSCPATHVARLVSCFSALAVSVPMGLRLR